MSIVCWDGKTLAADKQGTSSGWKTTVTKIRKINGDLMGGDGTQSGLAMFFKWYEDGAKIAEWPKCQDDKDRWCAVYIIKPDGRIFKYEQEPVPFEIEDKKVATGSGRDYALAGMELGLSAKDAVLLASKFESSCGNGVDTLEF